MKRQILTGAVLAVGIIAGIGLVELGLRAFMPQLLTFPQAEKGHIPADALVYAPGDKLIVKPSGTAETHEITFNEYGYRDPKDIAVSNMGDWVVFGGTLGFGLGSDPDAWFGSLYDYEDDAEAGKPEVYNATFVGASNYFKPMVNHAFASGSKAGRAVFVVDMSQHPEILLNQKDSFDAPQQQPVETKSSFIQRLAVARALGIADAPEQQLPEPITMPTASRVAQAMWPAIEPYTSERERNVVLVVPARGYWLQSAFGTVHRQNQENVARALRALKNVYVVDVSYMMRNSHSNPINLYYDNGRLKPEGQKILATGLEKQVQVFDDWKSMDELTPAEREKVKKQMEESARKREEDRRKNIFE